MSSPAKLPQNVNLEFLRKEAKSLLKRCRSKDAATLQRMRSDLPRLSELSDDRFAFEIRLADVHQALARERGYANWGDLKEHNSPDARPDFSSPGADGSSLPEGFNPWRWCVSYTVRPEILAQLVYGREYKITISVLRNAPENESFTEYAELYDRASALAGTRVKALQQPEAGMFLHDRIITHGWFRHKNFNLVRVFLTTGVTCLKEGDPLPLGEDVPSPEALTAPGGMTPDNYTPAAADANKRIDELFSDNDARDLQAADADIFLVSYGEYVPTCAELNYEPFVGRAEQLARSYYPFLKDAPVVIRREWFCATNPDIAVVHIYLRV